MKRITGIVSKGFFAMLIFASVSFAAVEIKSDYDRNYSLDKLHYFRFAKAGSPSSRDAFSADELVAKRIQRALEENLVAADYAKFENADFVVSYHAVLRNQAQVTTSGFPRLGAGRVWVDNFSVGTVIVEFRNARSGDLVWRGFVSGAVDPNKSEEKINEGIKKLIARFTKDRDKQKAGTR
jgi:hypothetical protein